MQLSPLTIPSDPSTSALIPNAPAVQQQETIATRRQPVPAIDKKLPTVLLTSFKGCKGLSAGHVFIVGVHDGCMPKDNRHVEDVEISQFIVALARTRKQCHVLSNDWLVAPRDKKGWIPAFEASLFVNWIPRELVEDRGKLRAKDFK